MLEKQEDDFERQFIKEENIKSEKEDGDGIDGSSGSEEKEEKEERSRPSGIEDILFKLPVVKSPLIGTPKQVQSVLDKMALKIQKMPSSKPNEELFNTIHLYMHGYLLNVVLKQFPYIKGYQTSDIYQESLIAIRFKALPNFERGKGMSFLNFAKMCIRRHLITILNASQNRQKDQSINQAVSLDSAISNDDNNTLSNIIPDGDICVDKKAEKHESMHVTKSTLMNELSDFEKMVMSEYLTGASYKEIAKTIAKNTKKRCYAKAVDNALLRIRKKALHLMQKCKADDLPLFIK